MEQGPARGINEDEPLNIDGVEFVPGWVRPSQVGSFTIQKSRRTMARYRDLVAGRPGQRIVELGILQGGSVAMLALVAKPSRLLAIEFSDQRVLALDAFIAERGLADVVRPHYGVDQADRERLEAIVAADLGPEPLDLVIDDASHRYAETVASFEVLFPRLAPGGTYVIEDWTCHDATASLVALALATEGSDARERLLAAFAENQEALASRARPEPLSRLAVELTLARAVAGDAVAEVQVDEDWLLVRRGPGPLDPDRFALRDLVPDHFDLVRPLVGTIDELLRPPAAAGNEVLWWSEPPADGGQ